METYFTECQFPFITYYRRICINLINSLLASSARLNVRSLHLDNQQENKLSVCVISTELRNYRVRTAGQEAILAWQETKCLSHTKDKVDQLENSSFSCGHNGDYRHKYVLKSSLVLPLIENVFWFQKARKACLH